MAVLLSGESIPIEILFCDEPSALLSRCPISGILQGLQENLIRNPLHSQQSFLAGSDFSLFPARNFRNIGMPDLFFRKAGLNVTAYPEAGTVGIRQEDDSSLFCQLPDNIHPFLILKYGKPIGWKNDRIHQLLQFHFIVNAFHNNCFPNRNPDTFHCGIGLFACCCS